RLAPAQDLLQRWTRQQPPPRARMALAGADVVAVEQHVPAVGHGRRILQHEAGEEPGGVGQVPFGRTGLGHRLDLRILRAERRGEPRRAGADLAVACDQAGAVHHGWGSRKAGHGPRLAPACVGAASTARPGPAGPSPVQPAAAAATASRRYRITVVFRADCPPWMVSCSETLTLLPSTGVT